MSNTAPRSSPAASISNATATGARNARTPVTRCIRRSLGDPPTFGYGSDTRTETEITFAIRRRVVAHRENDGVFRERQVGQAEVRLLVFDLSCYSTEDKFIIAYCFYAFSAADTLRNHNFEVPLCLVERFSQLLEDFLA